MSAEGSNSTAKPTGDAGAVESQAVSEGNARSRKPRPLEPSPGHEWLTLRQAALTLQVSPATMTRLYRQGEVRAVLVGHCLRISRPSLEAYLARRDWTPALCAAETARPRAGGRRRRQTTAPPSLAAEVMNHEAER